MNDYQLHQQQMMEQQIHTQFLQSEEGKLAEQEFVNSKMVWWNKLNGIKDHSEVDNKLSALQEQVELLTKLLTDKEGL